MKLTSAISEILEIKSFDGYILKGKLTLPAGAGEISKLVIYLNGSGPKTYHIDFFPEYYANNGIAFFSFNTRGVYEDDDPASIKEINDEEYKTYLPSNTVEDIFHMIKTLNCIDRLKDSIVLLNGWSEGTMIAPLFAVKYPKMVSALLLCGYTNDNMRDTVTWQMNTGWVTHKDLFSAIERNDAEWVKTNYGITMEWVSEHFKLTGNRAILPMLDLPIYILQGKLDTQCDINGVYEIRDTFSKLGKTNLSIYIFEKHDHCLDTEEGIADGKKKLVDIVEKIKI